GCPPSSVDDGGMQITCSTPNPSDFSSPLVKKTCYQGCPQVCSYHWRSEEASSLLSPWDLEVS
ncbi:unnamed protein product, partial [Musa acuminata var. zebrina]